MSLAPNTEGIIIDDTYHAIVNGRKVTFKKEKKQDYIEWESFLRHWEGDLAIHPVVRERILRKLFNIK
jgi:hypothetical protein